MRSCTDMGTEVHLSLIQQTHTKCPYGIRDYVNLQQYVCFLFLKF